MSGKEPYSNEEESMMIPYYIYMADIANELFEELEQYDNLPHEILEEVLRLENAYFIVDGRGS